VENIIIDDVKPRSGYNISSDRIIIILLEDRYPPPNRYYYFDVVAGLAWSHDPESYAGGSVAAGRASHAGQVSKVMIQTKSDTLPSKLEVERGVEGPTP
jgi:hypothetical protein